MTCTEKFYIRNPKTGEPFQVPCGHCMACRIAKTREWTVRLIHELSSWDKSGFFTLTYNDENIPFDGSLNKDELQKFFKMLRKDITPVKYFACGEYGDITLRPHYHMILFGVNYDEIELINENWKKGFTYGGTVTADSIQYVVGYIRKKLDGLMGRIAYGPREVPFQLVSKGLGAKFLKSNVDQIRQQGKCTVGGRNYGVPLYYRRQLGDEFNEVLKSKAIEAERSDNEIILNEIPNDIDPYDQYKFFTDMEKRIRELRRSTLKAQYELYKRKL